MKVIGINGSSRINGNTAIIIRTVFAELEAAGIETELIQLGGQPVRGCMACRACSEKAEKVLGENMAYLLKKLHS